MDTPFEIGDVYWLPRYQAELVTRPCPACRGTRIVTVIYGDERVSVDCGVCSLGCEERRGVITEYDVTPHAEQFIIESVDAFYNGRWTVCSTAGQRAEFDELCKTEAEALVVSAKKCAEQEESNMLSRQRMRNSAKHTTWAISYHKKCIADLARQIAWHTARVNAGKVKKEKP